MRWTVEIGRALGAVAVVLLLVLAAPAPAAASPGSPGPSATEARVLELVNEDRSALGLPPLSVESDAAARAREIAAGHRDTGRMAHTPPDRLAGWYMPPHDGVAELLAHAGDTAEAVHAAWMASDYHRGLLRTAGFELAGIGLASSDDGSVWAVAHLLDPPPGDPPPDDTVGPTPGENSAGAAPVAPAPPPPPPPSSPASTPSPPPLAVTAAGDPAAPAAVDPGTPATGPATTADRQPVDLSALGATAQPATRPAGEPAPDGPAPDGFEPDFGPELAAAVSAPGLALAAAIRRRRR